MQQTGVNPAVMLRAKRLKVKHYSLLQNSESFPMVHCENIYVGARSKETVSICYIRQKIHDALYLRDKITICKLKFFTIVRQCGTAY